MTFKNPESTYQLRNLSQSPSRSNQKNGSEETEFVGGDTSEEEKDMLLRTGRTASSETFKLYTPEEECVVVRKLDRNLVLFVALLYMLSFLDRSNIGNARIAGLSSDLGLSSSEYDWLLTAFYITYILFEWMILLYRVIPPHIYIALCVASWALIASAQSCANSFSAMVSLRALLGISEAAFGPGMPFYLSFFFKREELALRTGLFISAAPLAMSFASSLAWAIVRLGEHGPIASWRLLFLIEGFPSLIVAVFAWYYLPDSPKAARYLTQRQKHVAKWRLRMERGNIVQGKSSGIQSREILLALIDPKCYITAAMFFSCNVAFSSLPVFLPTIIEEMGYSSSMSQALSAPPYLFAFLVVLVTAFMSDRCRNRGLFICFHALLGAFGYLMIAIAGWQRAGTGWRYAGVYFASAGFFSAVTIIITWTINNQDSHSKKGTSVAMLNLIGQLGPLIGTRLYPDEDKPYYVKGMSVCAGFMVGVFCLSIGLRLVLARANATAGVAYSKLDKEDGDDLVSKGDGLKVQEAFLYIL